MTHVLFAGAAAIAMLALFDATAPLGTGETTVASGSVRLVDQATDMPAPPPSPGLPLPPLPPGVGWPPGTVVLPGGMPVPPMPPGTVLPPGSVVLPGGAGLAAAAVARGLVAAGGAGRAADVGEDVAADGVAAAERAERGLPV
ncbi:hypothetical protein [Mycobacterium sp.]|uniref:hypothetical protein n=1 Tax=Mycobacterium sp. TaxID=1785 RepID=UPI003F95F9E3